MSINGTHREWLEGIERRRRRWTVVVQVLLLERSALTRLRALHGEESVPGVLLKWRQKSSLGLALLLLLLLLLVIQVILTFWNVGEWRRRNIINNALDIWYFTLDAILQAQSVEFPIKTTLTGIGSLSACNFVLVMWFAALLSDLART